MKGVAGGAEQSVGRRPDKCMRPYVRLCRGDRRQPSGTTAMGRRRSAEARRGVGRLPRRARLGSRVEAYCHEGAGRRHVRAYHKFGEHTRVCSALGKHAGLGHEFCRRKGVCFGLGRRAKACYGLGRRTRVCYGLSRNTRVCYGLKKHTRVSRRGSTT
ncbi:hypothetical protein E2C01_048498 [Portunus trituberculatus]|uniref:Uncharacterized protein n=1 Tax=Portunus trituberculatus TaxID=210409 RepID=A0A5B7GB31_PORTR|nr:hypothetical protein [Portunus trituberculatus]